MGYTKFDNLNAIGAHAKVYTTLPTTPTDYYGSATGDVSGVEWQGGELVYYSTDSKLYIQTATSGSTPTWRYLDDTFATTTSTSTSTSTSTTTSSSTTTSTSTSTSSSTSTSTSTSSTTTAA